MLRMGMFIGDRYEILNNIGSGGMADVYKGKDHKLNRFVAVKVLKEEFCQDKNFVRKFKEEAQAAAALAHPNIVNVYDVGDEEGIYYIVMELVEGITLKTYIERKGKLTVKEATSIAIQMSAGLEIAHHNQIIHRDIKPQNIIISKEGKVKVTDFGIAKSAGSNTIISNTMGSVHYTSPEQARGGYSDAKSDIYSLGIVMYEMITGRVPFDGETPVVVAVKHLQDEMVPPSVYEPMIPKSLEQIILKCTQKSPDRRYGSMEELIRDLKQSLVTPDGDFVVIPDPDGAKTVALTRDDVKQIKRETGRIEFDPDMVSPKSKRRRFEEEEDEEDEEYDEDEDDDDDEYYEDDEDDEDEDDDDEDDDELSPKLEKIMTIGGIAAAIIIVLIVVFLVGKTLGLGKGKDTDTDKNKTQTEEQTKDDDGEQVEVPDLDKMSYTEAKEALNKVGLGIKQGNTEQSDKYEQGQIMGQSIKAGTKVDKNTTIEVTICGGSDTVEIPDVTDLSKDKAEAALKEKGFKVSTSSEYSDTVAEGKVIGTTPKYGYSADKGATVTLIVSKGPEAKKVSVPELTDRTLDRAKEKIQEAGLAVGTVTEETSTVEKGYVISSDPKAGTQVEEGTKINLVVSKGAGKVKVPEINGGDLEDVKNAIKNAGLKYDSNIQTDENDGSKQAGSISRLEPASGTEVDAGSTVKIYMWGSAPAKETIPDLTGMTESQAKSALEAKGFLYGGAETGKAATNAADAGKVYQQSQTGQASAKTSVKVTIYGPYTPPATGGGDTTTTPPSTGGGENTQTPAS